MASEMYGFNELRQDDENRQGDFPDKKFFHSIL